MEYWVDRRGYCYITWSFTIAMWCHNDFPQSSNYYLLSSNSYTQHRLTKIWWQSPKISRNYSISRYSDHSRLLYAFHFTSNYDDTTNCAIMTRDMTRETLAMTHEDSDLRLMTRDSAPGKSNNSRLDSRLGTCDSGLDSTRLDSRLDS